MSSMIELVKALSKKSLNEELVCTREEYGMLTKELHELDPFLKNKYLSHESIPRIFSLYGVKIHIV